MARQRSRRAWVWRILTVLPGAALIALLAPRVSYRRQDALTVLFFPAGLRIAWIIGTRLAQLPYRTWPTREDAFPLQDRRYAWIALFGNRYNLWRQRRFAPTSQVTPKQAS